MAVLVDRSNLKIYGVQLPEFLQPSWELKSIHHICWGWETLIHAIIKNCLYCRNPNFSKYYPCAAVKGIVSLKVWRQHCSPFPPRKRVFSMDKTFESWSLATPRSKSLVVLSLCHSSTSNGNLKCRKKIGNLPLFCMSSPTCLSGSMHLLFFKCFAWN